MPSQLLPRQAYTDPAWFEREKETLFAKSWALIGFQTDLCDPGDYVARNAGGFPLAVVMDNDGALRGFHNICRHRGTELLEGKGNAGRTLVCPYHRWTYALDGRLRGAPELAECFPNFDRKGLSLHDASVGVWKGMIFANPDPDQDFEAWIAPVRAVEFPHNIEDANLTFGDEFVYSMNCNWKVFFENAIDGYHLAYLHENTLGGPKAALNEWECHGDAMVWYSTERDGIRNRIPKFVEEQAAQSSMPTIAGAEHPGYGGVYMLFPLTLITPSPWSLTISRLEPVGAGHTILRAQTWVAKSWWSYKERLADAPGYSTETGMIESRFWTKHPLETGDFQTEDIWVCEKMQRSLGSPRYSVGPMAEGSGGEAMLEVFQNMVLERMGD